MIKFLEKPDPAATASRRQSPCFYLLSSLALPFVAEFLESRNGFLKTNFNYSSGLCCHKNWSADLNQYVSVSRYNI